MKGFWSGVAYFSDDQFQEICLNALQQATGRNAILSQTSPLISEQRRLLIRVGLLSPELGGQLILDIPLLTALNLSALRLYGHSFTHLNRDHVTQHHEALAKLLGLPSPLNKQLYYCHDHWLKRFEINLGPLYANEKMKVSVVQTQGGTTALELRIGPESAIILHLSEKNETCYILEERIFHFKLLDQQTLELSIDESSLTLGKVTTDIDEQLRIYHSNQFFLIQSAGSLVKSNLLEIANQIAPQFIPHELDGDISPPQLIASRSLHLPVPYLQQHSLNCVLMGAGSIRIALELAPLKDFSQAQLRLMTSLFNFTFYHPTLKKLFGSL